MLEFFGQRCNQNKTRYYGIVQVEDRTETVYGRLTDSNPHRHIKQHRSVTSAEKYFERKMFEKLMDGYEETTPPFHPYSITLTTTNHSSPALRSPPLDASPTRRTPPSSPPQNPHQPSCPPSPVQLQATHPPTQPPTLPLPPLPQGTILINTVSDESRIDTFHSGIDTTTPTTTTPTTTTPTTPHPIFSRSPSLYLATSIANSFMTTF